MNLFQWLGGRIGEESNEVVVGGTAGTQLQGTGISSREKLKLKLKNQKQKPKRKRKSSCGRVIHGR
jgi:hypothetical protein